MSSICFSKPLMVDSPSISPSLRKVFVDMDSAPQELYAPAARAAALLPPSGEMARARGTSGFPPARRTGRMGFTDIGQLRFMPRQRRSGRHQRRKTFPPPWNIAPAPESPFMRKSGAGPKGGFKKAGHRASLRAVRVEGTTDLPRRAKGFAAPRRRRRIVFYTTGGGNSATSRILAVSSSSWKCGLRKITHLYAPGFPGSSLTSTRASRSG